MILDKIWKLTNGKFDYFLFFLKYFLDPRETDRANEKVFRNLKRIRERVTKVKRTGLSRMIRVVNL